MITKRIALTAHIQVVLAPSSSGTKLKSLERILNSVVRRKLSLSQKNFCPKNQNLRKTRRRTDLWKRDKLEKFIIGSLSRFLIYRTLHTHIYELCLLYP